MPWHNAVPSRGGRAPALVRLAASLASLARYSVKADVAGVVVFDQHFPLVPGPFPGRGVDRAVRVHDLAGVAPAEHVGAGIDRVTQDPGRAGMGEPAPAQLPGPRPAIGTARETPVPCQNSTRSHDLQVRPAPGPAMIMPWPHDRST